MSCACRPGGCRRPGSTLSRSTVRGGRCRRVEQQCSPNGTLQLRASSGVSRGAWHGRPSRPCGAWWMSRSAMSPVTATRHRPLVPPAVPEDPAQRVHPASRLGRRRRPERPRRALPHDRPVRDLGRRHARSAGPSAGRVHGRPRGRVLDAAPLEDRGDERLALAGLCLPAAARAARARHTDMHRHRS